MKDKYKIFVINPGSTSTKVALFENENRVWEDSVFHDADVILSFELLEAARWLPFLRPGGRFFI